jgi:hypothetical protein
MTIAMDALRANQEVQDRLAGPFDFRVATDPREPVWFSVDGAESIELIGENGAGGAFVRLEGSPRVLYVSSEGEAGIIAANLDAFVRLIVACPYWRDLLTFSGNGNLDEMRRAAPVLDGATLDEEDDLDEARAFLIAELGLEPDDPVGALHRAVSTSDVVVRAPDGTPCAPLAFGRSTIDENPMFGEFEE